MKFLLAFIIAAGVASTTGGLRFAVWLGAAASQGASVMTGAARPDLSLVPYFLFCVVAVAGLVSALLLLLRDR